MENSIHSLHSLFLQKLDYNKAKPLMPINKAAIAGVPPQRERRTKLSDKEKEALLEIVSCLGAEAQKSYDAAEIKKADVLAANIAFHNMRSNMNRLSGDAQKKEVELRVKMKALYDSMASIDRQINEIDKLIRHKVDEYRKKKKKLEKWVWVPGYNLYLLIDTDQAYNNLIKERNRLKESLNSAELELRRTSELLRQTDISAGYNRQTIQRLEEHSAAFNNLLNFYSDATGRWNGVVKFYSDLMVTINTAEFIEIDGINARFNEIEGIANGLYSKTKSYEDLFNVAYAGHHAIQNVKSQLYVGSDSKLQKNASVYSFIPVLGFGADTYLIMSEDNRFAKIETDKIVNEGGHNGFSLVFIELENFDSPYFWKIRAAKEGMTIGDTHVFDVTLGSFHEGNTVWCYPPNNTPAQEFKIVKVI